MERSGRLEAAHPSTLGEDNTTTPPCALPGCDKLAHWSQHSHCSREHGKEHQRALRVKAKEVFGENRAAGLCGCGHRHLYAYDTEGLRADRLSAGNWRRESDNELRIGLNDSNGQSFSNIHPSDSGEWRWDCLGRRHGTKHHPPI